MAAILNVRAIVNSYGFGPELQDALQSDECERHEAARIVRSLVTAIEIIPTDGRGQVELKVRGALAELLDLPNRKPGTAPSAAVMVAVERYIARPTIEQALFCYRVQGIGIEGHGARRG